MKAEERKKPELILITDEFPYSYKEASFLRPELDALAERFRITLVSKSANKTQVLPVREGVRVLHYARPGKAAHLAAAVPALFDLDFREEVRRIRAEKAPRPFARTERTDQTTSTARMHTAQAICEMETKPLKCMKLES